MFERAMPEGFGGLEHADQTIIHPLALLFTLFCALSLLVIKRERTIWPILLVACLVPSAQRIALFTIDFKMLRIIVIFALLRLLVKQEYHHFQRHPLDFYLGTFFFFLLSIHTIQTGYFSTLVFEVGSTMDALGIYLFFRCTTRTWSEIENNIKALAITAIPVSLLFFYEHLTGMNMFYIFGGVPKYTLIREGALRCQGPFPHAIIAGAFWASLLPLFVAIARTSAGNRFLYTVSVFAVIAIVSSTSSSTPLFGIIATFLGWLAYFVRNYMRHIRWAALIGILSLHMVMKAPVWHLISRVGVSGGSTGHFRYLLIDNFIRRADEWWLVGTSSTAHWFTGAQDITNHYILQGVRGGLLSFIFFLTILGVAFRSVGRSWRRVATDRKKVILTWSLGVSLFAHCMMFFGVSYFGSMFFLWNFLLATIANADIISSVDYAREEQTRKSEIAH